MSDETRKPDDMPEGVEAEGTPVYDYEEGTFARDVEPEAGGETCAQCGCAVTAETRLATENAVFCADCYDQLKRIVEESVAMQSKNINYPMAVVGGLAGGLLGAAVWWGFTILTNIQFGLVAVLIGWATGKGVVMLSGNKRAVGLQAMSVVIAGVCYLLANYWVIRSSIIKYYGEQGQTVDLALIPDLGILMEITTLGFEFFDLIFIAIALWQAWKMPAPFKIQAEG